MEVLYPRCYGLDVHKSAITACVLIAQAGKPLKHIRRFGSTTRELHELVWKGKTKSSHAGSKLGVLVVAGAATC
jgi:hypothetical protein